MKYLMSFKISFLTMLQNVRVFFPFLGLLFSLSVFHFAFGQANQGGHTPGVGQVEGNACKGHHPTLDELREIFVRAIALQQDNDSCKLSGFKYFGSIMESTRFKANDGYSGPLLVTSFIKQDEDGLIWDSVIMAFRENIACLESNTGNDGFRINYMLKSSSIPEKDVHEKHIILGFDEDGRLMMGFAAVSSYEYVFGKGLTLTKGENLLCGI